jgi:EmrB/QacA subfamily drug resistance transporter
MPMPDPDRHARRVLALTSLGVFIVFLDTTIVNVAFDTISRSFGADITELVWVLNAYTLVFAACLIPAGRLTDTYGARRYFQLGLAGFALSSLACGIAPSLEVLLVARAAQAVSGAIIVPASLALLLREFSVERRAAAVSTWGAMAAVATAIGPTLGALLIEHAGWRWVFLVNLPVCVVAVLWSARLLPAEPRTARSGGLPDPLGVLLSAVGPALLSLAVIFGPRIGWGDVRELAALAAGALLIMVLVWRTRHAANPVVDPALFRIRNYQASNVVTLIFSVSFFAFLLSSLLFLQNVWHYSPLRAALAVSPSALITAAVAPQAARLADRFGYRVVFAAGALCYAAGSVLLAVRAGGDANWTARWLPSVVLNGIGVGLALSTLNSAAARALPADRFGVGSAVNNSFRQFGALLGVSLFVAVLGTPATATATATATAGSPTTADYHRVWWVLALITTCSAVVYAFTHREDGPVQTTADLATEPQRVRSG